MLIGSAEPDPQCPPPSACFGARAVEKAAVRKRFRRARRPATATECERFRRKHSAEATLLSRCSLLRLKAPSQGTRSPARSDLRGGMRSGYGGGRRAEPNSVRREKAAPSGSDSARTQPADLAPALWRKPRRRRSGNSGSDPGRCRWAGANKPPRGDGVRNDRPGAAARQAFRRRLCNGRPGGSDPSQPAGRKPGSAVKRAPSGSKGRHGHASPGPRFTGRLVNTDVPDAVGLR